jgi:hypothetical protein
MKEHDIVKRGEQYLMEIVTSKDPTFLRNACLETIVLTGHLYRRIQIHTFLHPFFFLFGFLACYFFMK